MPMKANSFLADAFKNEARKAGELSSALTGLPSHAGKDSHFTRSTLNFRPLIFPFWRAVSAFSAISVATAT